MKKIYIVFMVGFLSLSLYAENPDAIFREAQKVEPKDRLKALELYSKAINESDSSWKKRSQCFTQRGIIFFDAKELIPSMRDFASAIMQDDKNFLAHKYAAKGFFMLRKYSDALDEIEKIIKLKKKDAEINYLRGRIFYFLYINGTDQLKSNMIHSSRDEFTKAVKLNKKYHEAFYQRAVIYETIGDFDLAMKDLESVLKIKKDYCPAFREIANIYLKKNEQLKALEYLEKCLVISEKYKPGLQMIVALCAQYQMLDKMRLYLDKALKFYPLDPMFRQYNLQYKIVPEESLPKMPQIKKSSKPLEKPVTETPKPMWLSVDEENQEEKPLPIKMNFESRVKNEEKKEEALAKKSVLNNTNWY